VRENRLSGLFNGLIGRIVGAAITHPGIGAVNRIFTGGYRCCDAR
jgi:hypothetical protein